MLGRTTHSRAAIVAAVFAGAAVSAVTLAQGASGDGALTAPGSRARNVILLQGDGMGTAQRELIRLLTVGNQGELAMNQLEHTGFVRTDPDDPSQMVTDSAAAATAFSTGVKSYNGAIATGPDRLPRTTLLELAKASGKATGLVTNSQITDASPAAFGSHVLDRNEQSEIARQYIEVAQPDVILGGGEDFWLPAGSPGAEKVRSYPGTFFGGGASLSFAAGSSRSDLSAAPSTSSSRPDSRASRPRQRPGGSALPV
jgi:alkaline phosphatase